MTTKTDITRDVWEAVWSAPSEPGWIRLVWTPAEAAVFTPGDSWYRQPQPFWVEDIEGTTSGDLINPADLVKAYYELRKQGELHCGSYTLDVDDPDACFGDIVLQHILYGKTIWDF